MARPFDIVFRTVLAALATLALLGGARDSLATVITVTTTTDEFNSDGDCSLREALFAANFNSAKDACPAGSSVQSDEIVLTGGALYALTLPTSAGQGQDGSLFVRNDTPTADVFVTVSGAGTATISQDAVPDTRALVVAPGAHLDMQDVTIQGGATGASDNGGGGGAFVGSNARLGLLRCSFLDNVSLQSGGAIRSTGLLVVEDSTFDGNVAAVAGGAISIAGNTSTLIKGSLFSRNEALGQFSGGGAIESADQISIVESRFVNNHAKTLGGAITHFDDVANQASISQSCFVGNAADFTHDAIDVFAGSEVLKAAGNWWGADNGPSGAGGGSGDGISTLIDFSPPANAPDPSCLPMEMVANGGFQIDGDGDAVPDRWIPNAALTGADGRACSSDGACIFRMRGNGNDKIVAQNIRHAGKAGDAFLFRARSRAKGVPASGGFYRATLILVRKDGSQQQTQLDFSPGKHGFERLSDQVTASQDYVKMRVRIEYGRASGVVRFDGVSLQLNP